MRQPHYTMERDKGGREIGLSLIRPTLNDPSFKPKILFDTDSLTPVWAQ